MDSKAYLHMKVINMKSIVTFFRSKDMKKRKGKYAFYVDTKKEVTIRRK